MRCCLMYTFLRYRSIWVFRVDSEPVTLPKIRYWSTSCVRMSDTRVNSPIKHNSKSMAMHMRLTSYSSNFSCCTISDDIHNTESYSDMCFDLLGSLTCLGSEWVCTPRNSWVLHSDEGIRVCSVCQNMTPGTLVHGTTRETHLRFWNK